MDVPLDLGSRHKEREIRAKAGSTVLAIRRALLFEDIANAANGMDQAWLAPCLELGAQVADVNFQDIRRTLEINPSDTIQDDLTGEHLAWTLHKEQEQFILGG